MLPQLAARALAVAIVVSSAACASGGAGNEGVASTTSLVSPTSAVAGEWVDVRKTTSSDSTVWLLSTDGDDALLTVHVGADGSRREERQHYGRWNEGRTVDSSGANVRALCFVRRPGRDAPSCDAIVVDVVRVNGAELRRLTVRGYVGQHHTGDRVLVERPRASAAAAAPTDAPTSGADANADAAAPAGSGEYHPRSVQPERPSVATHAGTVAAGYLELETGLEHDSYADATRGVQLGSVFKLGLAKRVQLSLTLPSASATGVPFGVGDLSLGLKWRVSEDGPLLQDVAILPSIKFNSGGDRGTGTTDVNLLLINSRTFGPIGVDINLAATWRSGDGTLAPQTATLWTVAAGIPISGALGWALETYGLPGTSGPAGSAPVVAVLTGPTWVVRPELALDAGVIIPVTGAQPRALYVGLVASLGRLVPR